MQGRRSRPPHWPLVRRGFLSPAQVTYMAQNPRSPCATLMPSAQNAGQQCSTDGLRREAGNKPTTSAAAGSDSVAQDKFTFRAPTLGCPQEALWRVEDLPQEPLAAHGIRGSCGAACAAAVRNDLRQL